MPSTDDVIKRLIYQFSSTGADQVAADMGKVDAQQQALAASATQVSKASLDLEQSFDRIERRFDSTIRAEQDFAKVQAQVNAAVAQNPALQDRANATLEKAQTYFEKAASGSTGFQKALDKAREIMIGFAAEGGVVGGILGSFGTWGVAAAAGIGVVTSALEYLKQGAEKLAASSDSLVKFAESTGLAVSQFRGLTDLGAQFGATADRVGEGMQKLTSNLGAAREGSGELYTQLNAISQQLALGVATTRTTADAIAVLAKAYDSATNATTRLNIARAAFGKGTDLGPILAAINEAGGLAKVAENAQKASGMTDELTKHLADLKTQIETTQKRTETLMESIYSEATLQRMKTAAEMAEKFAIALKASADYAAQINASGGFWAKIGYGAPSTDEFGQPFPVQTANVNANTAATNANTEAKNTNAAASGAAASATDTHTVAIVKSYTALQNADAESLKLAANTSGALVNALGSAATVQEKETAAIAAFNVKAKEAHLTQAQYNAGIQEIYDASDRAAQAQASMGAAVNTATSSIGAQTQAMDAWTQSMANAYQGMLSIAGYETNLSKYGSVAGKTTDTTMPVSATMYGNIFGQYNRGATSAAGYIYNGVTYPTLEQAQAAQKQDQQWQTRYAAPAASTQSVSDYIDTVIKGGGVQGGLSAAMRLSATSTWSESDIESEVKSLYDTINKNASSATQVSNLQSELAWLQGRPASAAQQSAIADLKSSIDSLTKSTDSLNSTNQDLLSPYYTQDPRTSHIGFRSQGMAQGGYVDVPGAVSANDNMIAVVPVASGERLYVDPMYSRRGMSAGANFTINISSPVMFAGNPNKDEVGRTMYQNNQSLAKQLRSAMQ